MEEILKKRQKDFINTMKRQNFEWLLIDSQMMEEDKFKPLPPAKIKPLKHKVKSKQYI